MFYNDNARYTVKLRTLMRDENILPLIEKALSTYPLYVAKNNPSYTLIPTREELNRKILNHYKNREIGSETVGRFLEDLEDVMNEIMPYYNQLYKSADILNGVDDDVFGNVDMVETYEQSRIGSSEAKNTDVSDNTSKTEVDSEALTNMESNDKGVNSTTPNGVLNIGTKNIEDVTYANDVKWDENISESTSKGHDETSSSAKTTSSGTSTNDSTEKMEYTHTRKGNQGVNTYAHDLLELRELFINIEQQIINDSMIQELFLTIW